MLWESVAYFRRCHLTLSSEMKGKKRRVRKRFIFSDSARTDQIVRCGDNELVFSFGFLFVWFFVTQNFISPKIFLGQK